MVVIGLLLCIVGMFAYMFGMAFRYDSTFRDERSTVPRIGLTVLVLAVGLWMTGMPILLAVLFPATMFGTTLLMERFSRADNRRKERAKLARDAAGDSSLLTLSSERHKPISDEELAARIGDVDWGTRNWWLTRGGRR